MSKTMTIVNNLAVVYNQQGKGVDVLLLHGWGDDHQTFSQLSAELSKNYRLTAPDLPGFGASDPPKTAWDLTSYAHWVESFCTKVGISPQIVIGHSNGGALAVHAIAQGQLKPNKLVLLASSGVRDTAKIRRAGIKVIAKTGKLATFWLPLSAKQKLQKKLYGSVGSDMLVAPELIETFKRTVKQDIQHDAKSLSLPTLLIYGSQDKATPIKDIGQVLHKHINGSKLNIVNGAGHFVHQDAPSEVNASIKDFLT